MDYIEVSGKNVDEALTNALIKLETTSDKVEYEVIEKGSSGILGLFNKPAIIRVRRKAEVKETVYAQEVKEEKKFFSSKVEQPKVVNKKTSITDSPKKEVEYNTVKSEPVNQTLATHEVCEQSAKPVEKVSKYTTVMPNDEIEKRIRTFLKLWGWKYRLILILMTLNVSILNFLEKIWGFLLAKEVKRLILSNILQVLL